MTSYGAVMGLDEYQEALEMVGQCFRCCSSMNWENWEWHGQLETLEDSLTVGDCEILVFRS